MTILHNINFDDEKQEREKKIMIRIHLNSTSHTHICHPNVRVLNY